MLAHSKQHPSGSSFAAVQIHPLASLAVSVASLLTAFRPFGAPSPLFAPPLESRLHPALKRGRSSSLRKSSIRGGVACYGLARGGRERGRNWAILEEISCFGSTPDLGVSLTI